MEKDFQNPWHLNIKQKRKGDVIHLTEKSKEKREQRKNQSIYKTVKNIMFGPHYRYKSLAKYFILSFPQNKQFN